ncbi:MAG: NAD(+) kinase [Nitrospirae bacterium RBG_19FT_COMBO_42_15]|nr:MAG: NAD(+) kinase [Nitrospirae bacterium RBG_19FT_COMBO_42_15]
MKKIGIIIKPRKPEAKDVLNKLITWLESHKIEAVLDVDTANIVNIKSKYQKSQIASLVDMIIVLGGDGTLLGVARLTIEKGIPILGVNLGGLGFLTEVTLDELYPTLEKVINGEFIIDERMMLMTHIHRQGETLAQSPVLNDIVINHGIVARMIILDIFVNSQFVTSLRGDGLIISTPTGSTAYSLSAGGPIIHPTVSAIMLTPVCPHTLTNRPIVIPSNVKIEAILKTEDEGAMVTFDGQVGFSLKKEDIVEVHSAEARIKLIRSPEKNYYEVLRKKLKWGER